MNAHSIRNNRGGAMVISLLVLLVLTMVGTLFVAQTKTETQIAGHDMRSTQALYNAEAGYSEAVARMSDAGDVTNYMGPPVGSWTTDPGWGRYLVLAAGNSQMDPDYEATGADGLNNDGDAQTDENNERYPEVLTLQSGNDDINYPWVKVHYKLDGANQVILFGDHDADITTPPQANLARGVPIIVVTSEGGQGTARRIVEVEAVKVPVSLVDSAVYTEHDGIKFNGTQFKVSGIDHDPATWAEIPGNPQVPGIATVEDPNQISGELTAQQENNVEGVGGTPSVTTSPVDLDLDALRESWLPLTETTLPAGTYDALSLGDLDNYSVTHVTGDLHVSGTMVGGGVLIVDGDFVCTGQFTWYGVVLVMENISFSGGGAGVHIFGATLTGGTIDDNVLGGQADLFYSSEAIARLAMMSPYVVTSWREL
jgi:hypothetical protein